MNLRTTLIGFLGGLAVTSALYYPLYVVFPARYLPGWQAGGTRLAWLWLALAAFLLLLTGFLAGWLHPSPRRLGRSKSGALAGFLAAAIGYSAYGAAAAGIYGGRVLLGYGLIPARDESHFLYLVAEPVISIIYFTYLGWLALVLLGTLLGALGGLLSPRLPLAVQPEDAPRTELCFRWLAFFFGLLLAVVQLSTYSLLAEAVRKPVEQASLEVSFPVLGVSLIPILTGLFLYLLTVALLTAWLENVRRSESPDYLRLYGSFLVAEVSTLWALVLVFPLTTLSLALPWQVGLWIFCLLPVLMFGWLAYGLYRRLKNAFPELNSPPAWLFLVLAVMPVAVFTVFGFAASMFYASAMMSSGSSVTLGAVSLIVLALAGLACYLWLLSILFRRQTDFMSALRTSFPGLWTLFSLRDLASLGLRITIWGGAVPVVFVAAPLAIVLIVITAIASLMAYSSTTPVTPPATSALESVQMLYIMLEPARFFAVFAVLALLVCVLLAFGGWLLLRARPAPLQAGPGEGQ